MTVNGSYLVADIGATNARFCLATRAGLTGEALLLSTHDFETGDALLDRALQHFAPLAPDAACLAIAGPVRQGRGRITNGILGFDEAEASRRLGFSVQVVNDFHALAQALPDLAALRRIGGKDPVHGVKAVLGPGSGLGMGLLVPTAGGWQVLPSEGGHADLAPGSPLEAELLTLLQASHGHVSWETVLSGPGLVRLYQAVCHLWGTEPGPLTAPDVTARGAHAEDPVCHQTLEIFFSLLGAAAGNLAVTVYALGGVYIGGGIVPRLADFAEESPLRRRFDERGAMSALVRDVPLYLILDDNPGLVGALACLREADPAD